MGGEVLKRELAAALLAMLAGCAGPQPSNGPAILRLDDAQAEQSGLAPPRPLRVDEIAGQLRSGAAPEALLSQARASGWDYRLSEEEAQRLREAGASPALLDHLTAGRRAEEAMERERRRIEAAAAVHPYWIGYGLYDPFWPRPVTVCPAGHPCRTVWHPYW